MSVRLYMLKNKHILQENVQNERKVRRIIRNSYNNERDLSVWAGPFFIVFAKYTLFRLKTQTVLAGRLAKMLGAVATEIGKSCEIHKFCYLGERQAFIIQIVF